jgi:hypothetical protein
VDGRPETPGPEGAALPEGVADTVPGDVPEPDGAGPPVHELAASTATATARVADVLAAVLATVFLWALSLCP